MSAQLTPKRLHDLSVGEARRRQAKQDAAKLKKEDEELEGFTFQPELNTASTKLKHGRINVMSDPEAYMQRIKEQQERKRIAREEAQAAKEQKELEACTFKPAVRTKCPSYHKKLAAESAASRLSAKKPKQTRPSWQ